MLAGLVPQGAKGPEDVSNVLRLALVSLPEHNTSSMRLALNAMTQLYTVLQTPLTGRSMQVK